ADSAVPRIPAIPIRYDLPACAGSLAQSVFFCDAGGCMLVGADPRQFYPDTRFIGHVAAIVALYGGIFFHYGQCVRAISKVSVDMPVRRNRPRRCLHLLHWRTDRGVLRGDTGDVILDPQPPFRAATQKLLGTIGVGIQPVAPSPYA